MEEPREQKQIGVRIVSCMPTEFHQFALSIEGLADREVQYTTSFQIGFDEKQRQLWIGLTVEVWTGSASERIDISKIGTETKFEFDDLEPLAAGNEDEISVPNHLLATLLGISLSSTRGLILGMSHSDILSANPMPILSPMKMLEQMQRPSDVQKGES